MDRDEFWIRLSQVNVLPDFYQESLFVLTFPLTLKDLRSFFVSKHITLAQQRQFWQVPQQRITSTLQWVEDNNAAFIVWSDDHYPPMLRALFEPPMVLWVLGNSQLLRRQQLAMIGSRKVTPYGEQWGRHFSKIIAKAGITVTSGLALGIDSVCHQGALEVDGMTVAVLGSGLAEVSPRKHEKLAQRIIEQGGALVSEFLPYELPMAHHFPRRNRIIIGLSQALCVIQAALRSGSLITAKLALDQGKDIFVLPASLGYSSVAGNHWLIQQGAYLVTEPEDVLAQLAAGLAIGFRPDPPLKQQTSVFVEQTCQQEALFSPAILASPDKHNEVFSPTEKQILAAIDQMQSHVDDIAQFTKLPIHEVMACLVELELAGWVSSHSGEYIKV